MTTSIPLKFGAVIAGLTSLLLSVTGYAESHVPVFEESDCPFDKVDSEKEGVACGYLSVPDDRSKPAGRKVKRAVAVMKGRNKSPDAMPTLYLSGGPGAESVSGTHAWLDDPLLELGDIVLFDQRGTGYSTPRLCPDLVVAWQKLFLKNLSQVEETEALLSDVMRCREDILNRGIDPKAYNSTASASDIDDLRRALGYAEWNLYGTSYGTRLAMVTMKERPFGIRAVVLDSPYPPDSRIEQKTLDQALERLFDACANDESCNKSYPDLGKIYAETVEELTSNPLAIPVSGSQNGEGVAYFNEQDFRLVLQQALLGKRIIEAFPIFIDHMNRRVPGIVAVLFAGIEKKGMPVDLGLYYAVQCADNAPFTRSRRDTMPFFSLDETICRSWNPEHKSAVPKGAVYSDIPTLLIAGEYDGATAYVNATDAARTLSNSYFYKIPNHYPRDDEVGEDEHTERQ